MIGFNEQGTQQDNKLYGDIYYNILKDMDLSPNGIKAFKLAHPYLKKYIEHKLPYLLDYFIQETSKHYADLPNHITETCLHLVEDDNKHPKDKSYNAYRTLYLSYQEQQREIKCLLKNPLVTPDSKKQLAKLGKRGFTINNMINACIIINDTNDRLLGNIENLSGRGLNPLPYSWLNVPNKGLTRLSPKLLQFVSDWQAEKLYIYLNNNNLNSLSGIDISKYPIEDIALSDNSFEKFPKELLDQEISPAGQVNEHLKNNMISYLPSSAINWLQGSGMTDLQFLRQQYSSPYHYIRNIIITKLQSVQTNGLSYTDLALLLVISGGCGLSLSNIVDKELGYIFNRISGDHPMFVMDPVLNVFAGVCKAVTPFTDLVSFKEQLKLFTKVWETLEKDCDSLQACVNTANAYPDFVSALRTNEDLHRANRTSSLIIHPTFFALLFSHVFTLYKIAPYGFRYMKNYFDHLGDTYLNNRQSNLRAIDEFRENELNSMDDQSQENYIKGYQAAKNWLPWLKNCVSSNDSPAFAAGYDDAKQKRKPVVSIAPKVEELDDLDVKDACSIM